MGPVEWLALTIIIVAGYQTYQKQDYWLDTQVAKLIKYIKSFFIDDQNRPRQKKKTLVSANVILIANLLGQRKQIKSSDRCCRGEVNKSVR